MRAGTLVNGGLTIELERKHPVTMLRPHGVLDAYTAADLRGALLEAVAEQAAGVIVDVSRLTVRDDAGLAVVDSIARDNQRWPGVGLVLAGADAEFEAAAHRTGIASDVPICPDEESARAELSRLPPPPWRREHIAPDRNAPALARAAVHDFCLGEGITGETESAQLVASELVTNAVVHAGTPIELTLRLVTPRLHIAVRDAGDGRAHISGSVDESAESGRGLVLVDALAASWGNFVPAFGKIVWATLQIGRRTDRC